MSARAQNFYILFTFAIAVLCSFSYGWVFLPMCAFAIAASFIWVAARMTREGIVAEKTLKAEDVREIRVATVSLGFFASGLAAGLAYDSMSVVLVAAVLLIINVVRINRYLQRGIPAA